MDTIVRQHIVFYGWVQGIGFRYRAIHAAEYYGATGWVRPGEMIEDMKLDELPTRLSDVTVRFTAVNPANYNISSGVFDMKTVMHIVDYEGNMMDENGNWVKAG